MEELKNEIKKILSMVEKIDTNNVNTIVPNIIFDSNMYIKCLIHELRTPISNVTLGLNSMEIRIKKLQETQEKLDNDCNCGNFLSIIHDLYNSLQHIETIFSKFCVIQHGVMQLNNFEPFSIKLMIQNVEKLLRYHIKQKNIQFEYNIDKDIHDWVYGDRINIKHCIINLVKNAIKYNNNDKTNSKIIININNYNNISVEESKKKNIIISVIDNNNCIPKNIKDKLFQPFNSSSSSGLGLYICKKILDLHDGIIEHEYISNQGNKFNIIINLEKFDNTPIIYENSLETIEITNKLDNKIKYNIIIIDDNEINLKLMCNLFKNNPKINNIMTANDGLDAINKICNNMNEIDIVFIDNQMPNLNGIQTIQLLRGINFDKIIIGITGSFNTEFSDFNNCGSDYVFTKPLDKSKIEIIMSFLNKGDITRHNNKKLQIINSQFVWV